MIFYFQFSGLISGEGGGAGRLERVRNESKSKSFSQPTEWETNLILNTL